MRMWQLSVLAKWLQCVTVSGSACVGISVCKRYNDASRRTVCWTQTCIVGPRPRGLPAGSLVDAPHSGLLCNHLSNYPQSVFVCLYSSTREEVLFRRSCVVLLHIILRHGYITVDMQRSYTCIYICAPYKGTTVSNQLLVSYISAMPTECTHMWYCLACTPLYICVWPIFWKSSVRYNVSMSTSMITDQ